MNSTTCCSNADYCIVDDDGAAKCCALGSTCGNVCDENHYLTNITSTVTTAGQTTMETISACAARACTSTYYHCPVSVGGGCCPYGSNCGNDSAAALCLSTAASLTTSATSNVFQCGTSGQVCTPGEACTSAGSGYYCAALALATASGVASALPSSHSGSKSGSNDRALKIGLGVGIPAGVILLSALTFLALRVRRQKLREAAQRSGEGAHEYRKAELPADQKRVAFELQSHPAELPADEQMAAGELHGEGIPAELPHQSVTDKGERPDLIGGRPSGI